MAVFNQPKPPVLCRLNKGEMIDVQNNFVDTFNWMVSCWNNLQGDKTFSDFGQVADEGNIEVKNTERGQPSIVWKGGKGMISDLDGDNLEDGEGDTKELILKFKDNGEDMEVVIATFRRVEVVSDVSWNEGTHQLEAQKKYIWVVDETTSDYAPLFSSVPVKVVNGSTYDSGTHEFVNDTQTVYVIGKEGSIDKETVFTAQPA